MGESAQEGKKKREEIGKKTGLLLNRLRSSLPKPISLF